MAPSDFRKFRDFSVPIVVVDCYYDELDYDCVLINNIQGAFNATNYLIQCGHKNVGYFHSSLDINTIRAADKTKGRPSFFTIPETEAALILLVDLLKSIDNLPTVAAVEAQINAREAAFADTYPG
jgi:hypothetical protein